MAQDDFTKRAAELLKSWIPEDFKKFNPKSFEGVIGENSVIVASTNDAKAYLLPDFYCPLSDHNLKEDEWHTCPKCLKKPRLWIFDNGEHAKCGCNSTYDQASASGQTIWEYHNQHNGDMTHWSHNDLRDKWNLVVAERAKE